MMIKRRRNCVEAAEFVVPSIPKAPRSARGRTSKKMSEDEEDQLCAFDLLAAVAGKLLQENENSSASSNETETKDRFVSHKNETRILDEHLSALSTSDGSQNAEIDFSIGISGRTDLLPYKNASGFEVKEKQKAEDGGQKTEDLLWNNSVQTQISELHHNDRNDSEIYINCCTKRSKVRAYRSPPHSGGSRVRKFMGYRYRKTSPKLIDHDCFADAEAKHVNRCKKTHREQDRGLDTSPVKKRKLFEQSSVVTSDGGFCGESFSKSDNECANIDKSSHRANEECSSSKHRPVSNHAKDSQVRFSIKSFKVPELLVEVPLTATVGSLKTTVMEAVSSVLRGGLQVEVMVRGKRISNESDTLIHSGISHNCNLDSLGFTLELSSPNSPSPISPNDHLALSSANEHKRSPSIALADSEIFDETSPLLPSLSKEVKIDHEMVPEKLEESKALALFPVTNVEPLAMVPMDQRSKRSELGQRRTRRPFSVSEVEALVQSVEEIGTGRWRDVKLGSFKNADHRTYVDLKDKWKTLVHTAQISPQQRRGQPVPQELLNRVLAAHSYWSQDHQIKPHTRTHFQPGNTYIAIHK